MFSILFSPVIFFCVSTVWVNSRIQTFNLISIWSIQNAVSDAICAVVGFHFHCFSVFGLQFYIFVELQANVIFCVSSNILSVSAKYFVDILQHSGFGFFPYWNFFCTCFENGRRVKQRFQTSDNIFGAFTMNDSNMVFCKVTKSSHGIQWAPKLNERKKWASFMFAAELIATNAHINTSFSLLS